MRGRRDLLPAIGFLAPNLAGFLAFTAGPVLFSLIASLTNWNLEQSVPLRTVGLNNYAQAIGDRTFWIDFVNTLYFMLAAPLAIAGSLVVAILLNRRLRAMTFFRTVVYLPSFTSGVAIMILWKQLYNPDYGAVNALIRDVSSWLHTGWLPPNWLISTRNLAGLKVESVGVDAKQFGIGAREALMAMGIWGAIGGNNMLLYLAALGGVPEELTEAAELEGAGRWACFRFVTWPHLTPTTFFIVVMSIIGGLQGGFEQARIMTGGGPAGTTSTLSYYIYTLAFEQFRMGYASAVSWVLFALVLGATLANWRFGNRAAFEI